jgi:Skp family chaperone for outer membrane proteins
MKRLLISASLAAVAALPSAANAQAIPPAIVAVVDLERVQTECNACKTARSALSAQALAEDNREKALATPLQTEQKSLQTVVDALKGKEPDAALQTRVRAFQTKAQQAQDEAARGRQQLQRNQAYIAQQIQTKLNPIYQQVMQRRGANVLVEQGATLATASAIDVTNDVLAALNAAMPTVQTTAPAAPANTTQGR